MTDSEDEILDALNGKVDQVVLNGRKLRCDTYVSDPAMEDREFVLRCLKEQLYGDMRVALTTTIWGRDIGTHTYSVPERTADYLLIWLRGVLEMRRWTRWLVRFVPKQRMRTMAVDVREEFPEFHPTHRFGEPVMAFYERVLE